MTKAMRQFGGVWAALWAAAAALLLLAPAAARAGFDENYNEKINGTTLHFRVRGENKANPYLVLLHGGPGFSAHMFYPWGASSGIEKKLNVVYLDQRGSGESERFKIADLTRPTPEEVGGYTLKTLVADIEGVRRFLKVNRWFVLGHSWGGMLGLHYVTAHPESVRGYIHVDGLYSQPLIQEALLDYVGSRYEEKAKTGDERAKKRQEAVAAARAMKPGADRLMTVYGFLPEFFLDIYYADAEKAGVYQRKIAEAIQPYKVPLSALGANEPGIALTVTENYATRDDSPLLDRVKTPTLIINGKTERITTAAMAQAAHQRIKNSTLLVLDNCGHFPFAEQPEKTTAAILAFADKQKK